MATRLGLWGHNTQPASGFSGKTPSSGGGGGAHPVGVITRLGGWGHCTRRGGGFAGKTPSGGGGGGGAHPVGRITRAGAWGHNTRRTGAFAGKAATTASTTPQYYGHGQQSLGDFKAELAARVARRRKDEFELIAILGAMIDEGLL